jgi:hypothetical protein
MIIHRRDADIQPIRAGTHRAWALTEPVQPG